MSRTLLAALAAALLTIPAVSIACGGGGGGAKTTPAASAAASATASPTPEPNKQPTVEDKVMPTPTKLPADAVALTVVNGKTTYSPKPDEARALEQTSISAEGKSYSGVSVVTLAQKVAAKPDSVFTIQGVRADGKRIGFVRGKVSEIGSTTVFVPLADGHFNVVVGSLPSDQWVLFAEAISFQ
jgi:hypothetical protein